MSVKFHQALLLISLTFLIGGCSPKLSCDNKEYLDELKNRIRAISLRDARNFHPSVQQAVKKTTITFDAISEPTKISDTKISCHAQVTTLYTNVQDGKVTKYTNPLDYSLAIASNEKGEKQLSYEFYGQEVVNSIVSSAKNDDMFSWTWERFGNSQTKGKYNP